MKNLENIYEGSDDKVFLKKPVELKNMLLNVLPRMSPKQNTSAFRYDGTLNVGTWKGTFNVDIFMNTDDEKKAREVFDTVQGVLDTVETKQPVKLRIVNTKYDEYKFK